MHVKRRIDRHYFLMVDKNLDDKFNWLRITM